MTVSCLSVTSTNCRSRGAEGAHGLGSRTKVKHYTHPLDFRPEASPRRLGALRNGPRMGLRHYCQVVTFERLGNAWKKHPLPRHCFDRRESFTRPLHTFTKCREELSRRRGGQALFTISQRPFPKRIRGTGGAPPRTGGKQARTNVLSGAE